MTRHRNQALAIAFISCALFAAEPTRAASVTQVDRATWGASGVPSYVTMYIYVPDQLAPKPPIVVAHHSCGTAVSGYINAISGIRSAADRNGFIIILPEATGRNCWDVGSTQGLTRDGGSDAQAIIQMVNYVLSEYDGDSDRVYALGGSSGAMMTQALAALYPDVFKAASARAGVPAGCWADGFAPSNQWGGNCAGGRTSKTAAQWGDLVRAMNPNYTGHRPRIQLFHGTADTTISYNNMGEAIKQWTNVMELSEIPTSEDSTTTPVSTYDRDFWTNECDVTVLEAWHGRNGSHSMAYEEAAILDFFGLDEAGRADPEAACAGSGDPLGGEGGAGGAAGVGGSSNAGGSGPAAGGAAANPGDGPGNTGAGGEPGDSPPVGTLPAPSNPTVPTSPTTTAPTPPPTTPTSSNSGDPVGTPSAPAGTAPPSPSGTIGGSGGTPGTDPNLVSGDSDGGSSGGGCVIGNTTRSNPTHAAAVAMGLALLAFRRRRRSARR